MGRQRLRSQVMADLYNTITEATQDRAVLVQAEMVKNVADLAERMSIEDMVILIGIIRTVGWRVVGPVKGE